MSATGSAAAWVGTLRLRTLPAGAAPVLIGAAYAQHIGAFDLLPALAALAGASLLQVGTNLANDYYDHVKGADNADRAGPRRASASGDIPPERVRAAAFATFGAAALVGVYLSVIGGWPILAIGVAGILSGILYTAGPKPLAYVGLGDLFVFVFFGPIAVAGTTYVQSGTWELGAAAWGVAAGLLSTAILVVNNLRDRPTDEPAGKRTLAVRFGDRFARVQWTACVAGALASPFVIGHFADDLWMLLPVAAGATAAPPAKLVLGELEPRARLNPALGATARVLVVFAVLASIGLIL